MPRAASIPFGAALLQASLLSLHLHQPLYNL